MKTTINGTRMPDAPSAEDTGTHALSRYSVHLLHKRSIPIGRVGFYNNNISLNIREIDELAANCSGTTTSPNPTIQ